MNFGMIKTVRDLNQKLTECADGTWLYQKAENLPLIKVCPANLARQVLAIGYQKNYPDETDQLLREYTVGNATLIPVVCAPPQLSGCYVPGVIDKERNAMTIHDIPSYDPCKAASMAHSLAMGEDIETLQSQAA